MKFGPVRVGFGDGESLEVEWAEVVWEPFVDSSSPIPVGVFGPVEFSLPFAAPPELWAPLLQAIVEPSEAREQRARETRLYWSGRPDGVTRQILRAFGVTAQQIGLVQRSAFSPEYRRRQRARVKRRRR